MLLPMNTETQHRKKDPIRLYQQLLESAAMIAGRDGIAALSLNAVAREAGVSKGGLLHHFPNKQALIYALFARLLAIMEEAIAALMQKDNISYGRFTRAYVNYLSALTDTQESRQLIDAPRDKCTLSCAINGIHAAFHYLKKNYISGCVMTVPTGW